MIGCSIIRCDAIWIQTIRLIRRESWFCWTLICGWVAKIRSDAGKVSEELRLGVSGCTSPDDVGPCWFPSSLDELGPCGATTGSVITELGVVWLYPSWLKLALPFCEALWVCARALQRGGLLQHTNLQLQIFRIDWARGTIRYIGNDMRNSGWIPHSSDFPGNYIPDRFGSGSWN